MDRIKSKTRDLEMEGFKLTHLDYRDTFRVTDGMPVSQTARLTESGAISYDVGDRFNQCLHNVECAFQPGGQPSVLCSYINLRQKYRRSFPGGGAPEPIPNAYDSQMACWNYWKWPLKTIGYDQQSYELARSDAYTRLIHLRSEMGGQHMNVARSVMELKDTKETLGPLVKFMRWVKSRIGTRVSIAKPFAKRARTVLTLKDTVAACASAYLWYQFGVEPTVSDVKQFIRELSQGKLRVRGYRDKQTIPKGHVVRARFRCAPRIGQIYELMYPDRSAWGGSIDVDPYLGHSWPGEESITWPPTSQIATRALASHRVDVSEISGVYFAQLKKSVSIDGLGKLRKRWEWSCPSFKTLWDLLPFSFLVDWVIDVGSIIERLEKRYVTQNYEEYLGPIWLAEKRRTVRYYPRLVSGDLRIVGVRAPVDRYHAGTLNVTWTIRGDAWRGNVLNQTFERKPVKETPTSFLPKIGWNLDAYRISTGMALLTKFAAEWR